MFRRNKILVRITYTSDEYKEFIYDIDTDKVFHSYSFGILFVVLFPIFSLIFRFSLSSIFALLILSIFLYIVIGSIMIRLELQERYPILFEDL